MQDVTNPFKIHTIVICYNHKEWGKENYNLHK